MLKRIFENILSNAIKYSEYDFHVHMYSNGTVEFKNKTDKLDDGFIEISNKAKNLDKVSIGKLFDRYYTVKNAKKSNGIGLSIAKQLVELCNGEIKAKYENHYLIIEIRFLND